jgi:hypothetical protein
LAALDNGVERGYERALIEDETMARCFPLLNAMTLEAIGAGKARAVA